MKPKRTKTETTKIFSERLGRLVKNEKEECFKMGKTLSESKIADNIGINRPALHRYLDDDMEIGINSLVKISKYYGVSTDFLLGLVEDEATDLETRDVTKITGLSGIAQETIKCICENEEPVNTSDIEQYVQDFSPFFFDNFTNKKALNYLLSDQKNLAAIVSYMKTYMMLYTLSRGLPMLRKSSLYKIMSNRSAAELQRKNTYYFFMVNHHFQQLVENVAKRLLKDIDLSTDEAAEKAGVWPPEMRYGIPIDDDFDEDGEFDG